MKLFKILLLPLLPALAEAKGSGRARQAARPRGERIISSARNLPILGRACHFDRRRSRSGEISPFMLQIHLFHNIASPSYGEVDARDERADGEVEKERTPPQSAINCRQLPIATGSHNGTCCMVYALVDTFEMPRQRALTLGFAPTFMARGSA